MPSHVQDKVSPIKRLTIPRLELCGTHLLTQLLCHVKGVLDIPASSVFAWTDSTVVLSWLNSNHKRFKTYVGNRVSFIVDQLPPNHWRHVSGMDNPADCASRGLFPSELISHSLWWEGPPWLTKPPTHWPIQAKLKQIDTPDEERRNCLVAYLQLGEPLIPLEMYSSLSHLLHVTVWIYRFIGNCRLRENRMTTSLLASELHHAERYWLMLLQKESFPHEMEALRSKRKLPYSTLS